MARNPVTPSRLASKGLLGAATLAMAVFALGSSATAAGAQSIVYLVRHAEPTLPAMGAPDTDPELNMAGRERAHALVHVLREAGITDVLSTDYNRTRQTAAPLAEALGLTVQSYDPRALDALARRLKSHTGPLPRGGTQQHHAAARRGAGW